MEQNDEKEKEKDNDHEKKEKKTKTKDKKESEDSQKTNKTSKELKSNISVWEFIIKTTTMSRFLKTKNVFSFI